MHSTLVSRQSFLSFTLSLLVGLLFALPAAAAEADLAKVEVSGHQLVFEPLIPFDTVRVSLVGPNGFERTRLFTSDDAPALALPLEDGLYKYELRFGPSLDDGTRAALAESRRDGTPPPDLGAAVFGDMVMSGAFTIAGGVRIAPVEEPATAKESLDKVVLTNADGVIRNSLCVGGDCPNAPAFSDSTMLMMENNTRIKFGDTSNAPFPNNDWEIEANSSSNGGQSYLGFNDCGTADNDGGCATDLVFAVEAGTRQNALRVESDGDVGFGTANPVVNLHVVDGDTPTLRLDQDGSSGFQPQIWDVAGNDAGFFVRDTTNGSTLPFRILPGASSQTLVVDGDDEVGINAGTNPEVDLHIQDRDNNAEIQLETLNQAWKWRANNSNDQMNIIDDTNGTTPLRIVAGTSNNVLGIGINTAGADAATTVSFGRDGGPNVTVDIQGQVIVDGAVEHADYVFEPEFELRSIDEHASFMWQKQASASLAKGARVWQRSGRPGVSPDGHARGAGNGPHLH